MKRQRGIAGGVLAVVIACGAAGACGSGQESAPSAGTTPPPAAVSQPGGESGGASGQAAGGALDITYRTQPDPPRSGNNVVEVTVRQADGSPVTDAAVTAVFSMPAMPSMNMPAMRSDATLAHAAAGTYRGTGELSMAGTWTVTLTVKRGDQEIGVKNFSVVAK